LENVRFSYGESELAQRYGKGLTWRFFKCERGRWHAHVSFDVSGPPIIFNLEKGRTGAIGVDINTDKMFGFMFLRRDHQGSCGSDSCEPSLGRTVISGD
jgi:hypothetical protein